MCYSTNTLQKLHLGLQELPFMRFSRVLNIDTVRLQAPTVICHHLCVIPSLITLFHRLNPDETVLPVHPRRFQGLLGIHPSGYVNNEL